MHLANLTVLSQAEHKPGDVLVVADTGETMEILDVSTNGADPETGWPRLEMIVVRATETSPPD